MGRVITHRLLSPVTAMTAVALVALGLGVQGCGETDEASGSSFDASSYPEQDITMVVPFGAGGGSDILSRTIASVIQELDLVPVEIVIENRTGGSGATGYDYVAKQAGNPYMLASLSVSFFTTPLLGASPVNYADFTPIAAIAMSPYIMAVRAESPIQSIDDVKAATRLTTGTTGVASDAALLANMLQNQSGVTIDAVPFDGEGEILAGILGGHLDFIFGNPVEILPNIQAGTLRAIAVSTGERLQTLPDVPSFNELGFDIEHAQVRGVLMPLDMPAEVVAYWEDILRQVATSDAWQRAYLDRFKEEPRFAAGEDFAQIIEDTNTLYLDILTDLDLLP